MKIHELKTWPEFYGPLVGGEKDFEVRKNDRNFRVFDILHLREWDPDREEYTGAAALALVTYIMDLMEPFGISSDNYVILGVDILYDN